MSLLRSKYVFRSLCQCSWSKWLNVVGEVNFSTNVSERKVNGLINNEKDGNFNSEINKHTFSKLNFNDTNLSKILLQVKSKKMREKSNLIFFEGKRILKEALEAGVIPLMIYFTRKEDIEGFKFPVETKLFKIPYNELKVWSDLTTNPGILAVCSKPDLVKNPRSDLPVTIICDNIREPGNLGALIRNAVGAGVKDVILSKGCVDVWDTKVIRGSSGTLFRMTIHSDVEWPDMMNYLKKDTLLVMATNKLPVGGTGIGNNVTPYCDLDYSKYSSIAVIIGGETEGVSENAHRLMPLYENQKIIIPLSNELDSLNCVSALSVVLFEIKRQVMFAK